MRAPNPHADAQVTLSRPDAPRNAHPYAADATVQPAAAAAAATTSTCIPTTTGAKCVVVYAKRAQAEVTQRLSIVLQVIYVMEAFYSP